MRYRTFTPPPPFDDFIENIWYWRGEAALHGKDTIMASGRLGLMVNLSRNELIWYNGERYETRNGLRGIGLCGAHAASFAIDAHQPHMMGAQFKPGGAFAFFGGSARHFLDAHISLEDIWGADAGRLHQRLVEAPTPDAKMAILFHELTALYGERQRHPAVALALSRIARAPHRLTVAALAREAEVSIKRLTHLFAEEVGMTPKLFLRVSRFQHLLSRIHLAPSVDWMAEVERHGYYDQPHFIREFREFSGFTPMDYLKLRGPFLQHVPLRD